MNLFGKIIPLWLVILGSFIAGGIAAGTAQQWRLGAKIDRIEAEQAKRDAAAAKTLTDETQKVRDREAAIAALNLKLEEKSGQDKIAIAAADNRTADALKRVRDAERAARHCAADSANSGATVSGEPAAGSWDRLSEALDHDHRDCAKSANTLASYARICNAFALSITCKP